MKKLYCLIFTIAFIIQGCKDDSTGPSKVQLYENYFPVHSNIKNIYDIDTLNQSGQKATIGNRVVIIGDTTILFSTPYHLQKDSIYLEFNSSYSESYVRATSNGVYYYVDTSAYNTFIPDSLKNLITLDNEIIFLSQPITIGRNWTCYKFTFANISLIDLNAEIIGNENIVNTLLENDEQINSIKIKYQLKVNLPDIGFGPININETAFLWFVKDIGLIKFEGKRFIASILLGVDIDMGEENDPTIILSLKNNSN